MMESQLATEVANVMLRQAVQANAMKVMTAQVVVGIMRQIDEALFVRELGEMLVGTLAEGARIELRREPLTMRCLACDEVYPVTVGDNATYDCPACGGHRHTVVTGMEIGIDGMEVIIPSEQEGPSLVDRLSQAVEDALGPLEKH